MLLLAVGVPLSLLFACLVPRWRGALWVLLPLAPVPAGLAALLAGGARVVIGPPIAFALDTPTAILLGAAALLWMAAGLAAQGRRGDARFLACWLATLAGCIGSFLAADMPGFYMFLALMSVGAAGLVAVDGDWHAGGVYLGLALLGEAGILAGFLLLSAGAGGTLMLDEAVASLANSPYRDAALAALLFGFGVKAAMLPFHVWMPLAYRAAPMAAAAALSGAVVKVSLLGLIHAVPLDVPTMGWGTALAAIGLLGAFYGVIVGVTQNDPRSILAYSSVSQMGLLLAVVGMGMRTGDAETALVVAFAASRHTLVKGALFLAIGAVSGNRLLLAVAALLAVGLGGVPLTGGALAKLALKDPLGAGVAGTAAAIAAAGTTMLMLHFVGRLAAWNGARVPRLPFVLAALASMALPWALYLLVPIGTLADAVSGYALRSMAWPVLLGVGLYMLRRRLAPRELPAGDIIAFAAPLRTLALCIGAAAERADTQLRRWPVSGMSLLTLALLLGLAMLASVPR